MKLKIALYGWIRYPDWTPDPRVYTENEHGEEVRESTEHVRITEPVEVDFVELAQDKKVAEQVKALGAEREEVVRKFTGELKRIDEHLQELRALAAPAPSEPSGQSVESAES